MCRTVVVLALLSCVTTLNGQNARLGGDIIDPSGSAIAGASVTLTNQGTRAQQRARTATAGEVVFPSVLPGIYDIQVQANGFKSVRRSGVKLDVAEVTSLRIAVEIGAEDQGSDHPEPVPWGEGEVGTRVSRLASSPERSRCSLRPSRGPSRATGEVAGDHR